MEIPPRHVARVINDFINRLDDRLFTAAHPGGGRNSYHPKMLTKVIVYAYSQRIYTSRQIVKAVRENIPFMWLAGRQQPDFRTINRFRSERMKEQLEKIFAGMLELLMAEGYIKLEHYFVDGKKNAGADAENVIADAGYGGEENYAYLEKEKIEAFVKYNSFYKEASKAWRNDISRIENWTYDEDANNWVCPNGRTLHFIQESKGRTESGYEVGLRIYRSVSCDGCPLKQKCTKSE